MAGLPLEGIRILDHTIAWAGPHAHAPAFGDCINAFCGLDEITGYEDSPPMRPGIAYGDPAGGFSAALAVLSALHYRFKTGKGQCVDVSHLEASTKCMDWLLDVAINRRVRSRVGNRDDYAAPQGCYPCKGDDTWVAISITSDEVWYFYHDVSPLSHIILMVHF